ncbi:hypothetical protein MOO45_06585 [Bombilactobacillus folatiphilus]|uniref:WxL domain-containing protein n=1 Tax=Bombilactobacillus folatiphilus TaxID=2923362 RepID=A0ABY4P8K9_9LACO|nr:hypothetical protein [Bombilactobacillus folatiphilus]UQS81856.1 hypothetical protein MOO45_06585 [Bombilactobacillus folatiphilus]
MGAVHRVSPSPVQAVDVTRTGSDPTTQDIPDDGLTGTTSVTVTFQNANIFLEQMPNFDFGTGHGYTDTLLSMIKVTGDRSLIVNSPDGAVPFSVSVANYGTTLKDSTGADQISKVSFDSNGNLSYINLFNTEGTNKSFTNFWIIKTQSPSQDTWSSVNGKDPAVTRDNHVALTSAPSSNASTEVLNSEQGSQGKIKLIFNDVDSAHLNLSSGVLNSLQNDVLSSSSKTATFIFPLYWTVSIDGGTQSLAEDQV